MMVERRGWFEGRQAAALGSAGNDVRQCLGPLHEVRACALVSSGECRLAQQADLIVNLLPADDPDCEAVLAAHRQRWPQRLAR